MTLSSIFDFNLTNSSGAQTTKAGLSATYNLDAAPLGGNFPNLVTLSCTGLPARSTCSFNPAQVNSGSGDTAIILTIATNAPIPVSAKLRASLRLAAYALLLPGVLVVGGFKRWLPKSRWYSPLLLLPLYASEAFCRLVVVEEERAAEAAVNLGRPQEITQLR